MIAATTVVGRLPAAIAVVLAVAAQAGAQAPATSFEELRLLVKPGDALEITERTGRRSSGRLSDLSELYLELRRRDASTRFAPDEISQIRLVRHDSLLNGTLIGLVAGAGPFLVVWPSFRDAETEIGVALGALIGGAVGAATGAAVDAALARRVTVYYGGAGQRVGLHVSFHP